MNSKKSEFLEEMIKYFKQFGMIELREADSIFLVFVFNETEPETVQKFNGIGQLYFQYFKILPMFLSREFIRNGCDVYPCDILKLKIFSKNLYGEDHFKDLEIKKADIRYQLEREYRSIVFNILNESINLGNSKKVYQFASNILTQNSYLWYAHLYLIGMEGRADGKTNFYLLMEKISPEIAGVFKEKIENHKKYHKSSLLNLFYNTVYKLIDHIDRLHF